MTNKLLIEVAIVIGLVDAFIAVADAIDPADQPLAVDTIISVTIILVFGAVGAYLWDKQRRSKVTSTAVQGT